MTNLKVSSRVPAALAAKYRAEGWWNDRRLADGLEAAAQRKPDALAVADNEHELTYAELVTRVNDAIAELAERDVGTNAGVVLVSGNTVDAVVGYHALLRVGATVVVLDRRCGPSDVRLALEMLGSPALVVLPSSEHDRLAADIGDRPIALVEALADARHREGGRWTEPDRDEPRVILFTSGTTRRPKGVVHSLNTVTAGANNMARITGADEHDVLFLVSPAMSSAGVTQMHLFADRHAALVLEDRFEPVSSLERLNGAGATLLGGAPVIAERLLRAAEASPQRAIALRALALGGAMLPRPLLEQATDAFGIEIARVYGSSEASCATGSVPEDDREHRLADDGVLMPGTEVRIGSANSPQEGLLRGPCVFLGYVDPDDDSTAFEDGWYRTGDLVEVNDGRLAVVGRLKEVVNRNGLKISLAEIDAALAAMPNLDEYACFAVPDPDTGERLALAVRPVAGATVTLDDVVAYLVRAGTARRKLPEQLVTWDEPLPRTPSGKVVRSRLAMDAPAKPSELVERLTRATESDT
jgi:acyl-CoA synthetase (AMP-forming)/AMP-acid ligase II